MFSKDQDKSFTTTLLSTFYTFNLKTVKLFIGKKSVDNGLSIIFYYILIINKIITKSK